MLSVLFQNRSFRFHRRGLIAKAKSNTVALIRGFLHLEMKPENYYLHQSAIEIIIKMSGYILFHVT